MPKQFDKGIREDVLAEIAKGRSLRSVCRDDGMPAMSTVMKWVNEDNDFSEQYARARDERTEAIFDELIEIADRRDNDATQRDRLRIDTRKWMLGKMAPKKYGDKVDLTSSDGSMTPQQVIYQLPDNGRGD